jgi:hypothetical protein
MAIKKIKSPKRSAKYYRKNKTARAKKKKYDSEFNKKKSQIKKRTSLNKKRRQLKRKGVKLAGKDISHTKKGLRLKPLSKNRGSKTDSAGDRRARGGKKQTTSKKKR